MTKVQLQSRKKQGKSGSHRKCDTKKHKRRKMREIENRGIKEQHQIMTAFEREHDEAEFVQRNFTPRAAPEVCPLCNQPITEEDRKGNVHKIKVDHKDVNVHRTCPGETN